MSRHRDSGMDPSIMLRTWAASREWLAVAHGLGMVGLHSARSPQPTQLPKVMIGAKDQVIYFHRAGVVLKKMQPGWAALKSLGILPIRDRASSLTRAAAERRSTLSSPTEPGLTECHSTTEDRRASVSPEWAASPSRFNVDQNL